MLRSLASTEEETSGGGQTGEERGTAVMIDELRVMNDEVLLYCDEVLLYYGGEKLSYFCDKVFLNCSHEVVRSSAEVRGSAIVIIPATKSLNSGWIISVSSRYCGPLPYGDT